MRLAPSPEQQAIKDSVRRFCAEQIPIERLRSWEKHPRGVDDELWRAAAALGWFGLGLPVPAGAGLGLVEVACLMEECARGLVPRVLMNAIGAAYALATLVPQHTALAHIARGDAIVALALGEISRGARSAQGVCLSADSSQLSVQGQRPYVADADIADWHLVSAVDEGADVALLLVPRPPQEYRVLRTLDGDRQFHVAYSSTPVDTRLSAAGQGGIVLERLQQQQIALGLAELLGAMDAALMMTVAYVKEREQFGQKIAVFQAVQHQVADMATASTAARHLAWQAITGVAAGTVTAATLATACAFVGQAAKRVTLSAHHLHGGAGYVVEHRLHYHSERAQALCIRYAQEGAALAVIAAAQLD